MTPRVLWFVIDLHLEDHEKDDKHEEERDDYMSITASSSLFCLVGSDFIFNFTCSVENSAGPELSFVSETVVITLSCEGSIHSS